MSTNDKTTKVSPTSSHWGNYLVTTEAGEITKVGSYPVDKDPTPIGQSLIDSQHKGVRIPQPMVRKSYLEQGPDGDRSLRGKEAFVPVSWETAFELASKALTNTKEQHGNEAIFGGSYGWGSGGRFHHAQSQVHRFLRKFGGYVDSIDDYSCAAAHVIVPRVLGRSFYEWAFEPQTSDVIIKHSGSLVLFGGAALKNTQINAGSLGSHSAKSELLAIRDAGVRVYNISPIEDDVYEGVGATWMPCKPNTDMTMMLGLCHTLVSEGLQDQSFLDSYCEGWDKFLPYLMGEKDGQIKDSEWASSICGVPSEEIKKLARVMAEKRCTISVSWSLQRQEHGEQNYWMAITLASALGYMGLPGGGITFGYGCVHNIGFGGGKVTPPFSVGSVPQGENLVKDFIPVARIADMLLHPGERYDYNGESRTYPNIKLVYWVGGNPFHHHQDINRLRKAWEKPETVIVHESVWTATARHADIVFPATTFLERDDISGGSYDRFLSPMHKALEPYADSKNDFDIFCGVAKKLGILEDFSDGLTVSEWVERLYRETCENAAKKSITLPKFEEFWSGGQIDLGEHIEITPLTIDYFRKDPEANALTTPSGKIEIFSAAIDSFNYDDCPGHPTWLEKEECLTSPKATEFPLHLVSNQPKKKLHSQYDFGRTSVNAKVQGREIVRLNPKTAQTHKVAEGDIVRLYNERGSCLASVKTSTQIMPNVLELPTGSWYNPLDPNDANSLEVHGNPNVLTKDKGSSKLAQGPIAHSCLVKIEKYRETLPEVTAFKQPLIDK